MNAGQGNVTCGLCVGGGRGDRLAMSIRGCARDRPCRMPIPNGERLRKGLGIGIGPIYIATKGLSPYSPISPKIYIGPSDRSLSPTRPPLRITFVRQRHIYL